MRLVTNFNENHLFRIKRNEMLLRLFSVIHKYHKLKQNNCDDKIRRIDFYFNEIIEIKMNQHERFCKHFDKSSKRLFRDIVKNE